MKRAESSGGYNLGTPSMAEYFGRGKTLPRGLKPPVFIGAERGAEAPLYRDWWTRGVLMGFKRHFCVGLIAGLKACVAQKLGSVKSPALFARANKDGAPESRMVSIQLADEDEVEQGEVGEAG